MYWLGFLLFQELLTYNLLLASSPQCIDDLGNAVDWVYAIKLPILQSETGYLRTGTGYIYVTPNSGNDWALSEKSLSDKDSFLGRTLAPLYNAEEAKNLLYMAYNDDPPNVHATLAYAHAKGIVMTDGKNGVWLVHSSPRFPELPKFTPDSEQESADIDPVEYTFPPTASKFGQSFLCLSLPHTEMETVGTQLEYMRPKVYASNVPQFLATKFPILNSVINGKYVKGEPSFHTTPLKTLGGTQFMSYAKSAKFGRDLYSQYVAKELKAPLEVETWSNGPGPLPSDYTETNQVVNIKELDFEVSGHKLEYWNSKDHSKWAVTNLPSKNYICVGDINRMMSQFKRGGGTICCQNDVVWKLYSKGVEIMDPFNLDPSMNKLPENPPPNPSPSKGSEDEGTSENSTKHKKGGSHRKTKSTKDNSPGSSSDEGNAINVKTPGPKKHTKHKGKGSENEIAEENNEIDGKASTSKTHKSPTHHKGSKKGESEENNETEVKTPASKKHTKSKGKNSENAVSEEKNEIDGKSSTSKTHKPQTHHKGSKKGESEENNETEVKTHAPKKHTKHNGKGSENEISEESNDIKVKDSKSKKHKSKKHNVSENEESEEDNNTHSTKKKSPSKTKSKSKKPKGKKSDDSSE